MRRGIRNSVSARIAGMDLTECSDIVLFIEQNGGVSTFAGTAQTSDPEVAVFSIPKADAVRLRKGYARVQVALTDGNGMPRSHDPIEVLIGNLLKEEGYGS